jgi:hypothetical protein
MNGLQELEWLAPLGIANRVGDPDLFVSRESVVGSPHASPMRVAFDQLGVSAFLCITGIPTVAFLSREKLEPAEVNRAHQALWNQGLSSLLLVILPTEVRAYSLWRSPVPEDTLLPDEHDARLVAVLDRVTQAMELLQLIGRVESGRFFENNEDKFDPQKRVDNVLLTNLKVAERELVRRGLGREGARALILQTIFIAYLEDREIIDHEYFADTLSGQEPSCLRDLLHTENPSLLMRLFERLYRDFNGDVFWAPCAFGPDEESAQLTPQHLNCLADFREGIEMESGQARFWPYNFRYIPVELISSIYDRFLNEDDHARRELGAYYTPRFLVDLVVDQVWNELQEVSSPNSSVKVLDPACGSAIFLVRIFRRMVESWRKHHEGLAPDWGTLKRFLSQLHGWDKQASAVRIGVFSLYVALLEEENPPTIHKLMREGKLLPVLFEKTLCPRDFFDPATPAEVFDVIIGNPPWVSRKPEVAASAIRWCKNRGRPMPGDELAWGFIWKSCEHLAPGGVVGLLLPAMGVLLNHSKGAVNARETWLTEVQLKRVINFADLCFRLFEGAARPAIFALFRKRDPSLKDYRFDYWTPKANRLLTSAQMVSIASVDRSEGKASTAGREPSFWKRRMWATGRDLRLLDWLSDLPKLGQLLSAYRFSRTRAGGILQDRWVIGQGFQELHEGRDKGLAHGYADDETITRFPFLNSKWFRPWVLPTITSPPWPKARIRRAGFRDGFLAPHILVMKGIRRDEGLIRAAYVEQPVTFKHSIQAIRFPNGQTKRAKLLTAVLNSRLAAWFCFHTTASLGTERAEVQMDQLLELPFPEPDDLQDKPRSEQVQEAIVSLVDSMLAGKDELQMDTSWIRERIDMANDLVYEYFGLTEDEIILVEDTVTKVVPSIQPRYARKSALLRASTKTQRDEYAETVVRVLEGWAQTGTHISARVLTDSAEWGLVELRVEDNAPREAVLFEQQSESLQKALDRVMAALPQGSTRNIQLRPDLRVFVEDSLFLVKPLETRYWLRTTALNDADAIAGDLLLQEKADHMSGAFDATRR